VNFIVKSRNFIRLPAVYIVRSNFLEWKVTRYFNAQVGIQNFVYLDTSATCSKPPELSPLLLSQVFTTFSLFTLSSARKRMF